MSGSLVGSVIFFMLGIILLTQPYQLFERNGPDMVRIVREKTSYKKYLRMIGCIFVVLGIIFCIIGILPKGVHEELTGIKYVTGNLQKFETVNIEIDGELYKSFLKRNSEFYGKISIGDRNFDYSDNALKLNKDNMGLLSYNESENIKLFGNIFVNGMFKKVAIEVLDKDKKGYSWNSEGGILIAAPCGSREEAVRISNDLLQKLNENIVIK